MCGFVNMQEPWLITVKLSVVLLGPFMAIKGLFFVCFKKKKKCINFTYTTQIAPSIISMLVEGTKGYFERYGIA